MSRPIPTSAVLICAVLALAGCGPPPPESPVQDGWASAATAVDGATFEGDAADREAILRCGAREIVLREGSPLARSGTRVLALPDAPHRGPDGTLHISPASARRLADWVRAAAPVHRPARRPMRVVVDPGHGGEDPGAIGPGGTQERDVTLDIGLRLEREMRRRGHEVILTRRDDGALHAVKREDLNARAALSLDRGAHAFVSIHADASEDPSRRGATTFYPSAEDKRTGQPLDRAHEGPLADTLAHASPAGRRLLTRILSDEFVHDGRVLARCVQDRLVAGTGCEDLGIRRHPEVRLRVISETPVPAVLVEVGHLSCAAEERLLADPAYRQRIAAAIADGLESFHRDGG